MSPFPLRTACGRARAVGCGWVLRDFAKFDNLCCQNHTFNAKWNINMAIVSIDSRSEYSLKIDIIIVPPHTDCCCKCSNMSKFERFLEAISRELKSVAMLLCCLWRATHSLRCRISFRQHYQVVHKAM